MGSTTQTSPLLLASLLCLLLLSEVGILMAQAAPAPAPAPGAPDECVKKCAYRCSKSWKPKMCNKTCVACCHRCPDHCVPNGPTAPRDSCWCYSQIKTHNKYKCP